MLTSLSIKFISTMVSLLPWPILRLNESLRTSILVFLTSILLIFLTLQNIGFAMSDVVAHAIIAEAVRSESRTGESNSMGIHNPKRRYRQESSFYWQGTGMDQVEGMYKERVQALLRAIYAARFVQDDIEPCQIEEGLYLGSLGAANNKLALKRLNVTHILTVAGSLAPAHPRDFTYKVVEVADREETNLAQYFDECIDFIDEAKRSGGGVLVHCFVGRSRSVTVVLAYLLKTRGMALSEALAYVRSKRPQASPNAGFLKQLQDYELSLRGCTRDADGNGEDSPRAEGGGEVNPRK